jgi:hypothetical protein
MRLLRTYEIAAEKLNVDKESPPCSLEAVEAIVNPARVAAFLAAVQDPIALEAFGVQGPLPQQ